MTDTLRHAIAALLFFACAAAKAQEPLPPSAGQTLYLPIYSDLWHGDLGSRKTAGPKRDNFTSSGKFSLPRKVGKK